jgi:hypothetical protein
MQCICQALKTENHQLKETVTFLRGAIKQSLEYGNITDPVLYHAFVATEPAPLGYVESEGEFNPFVVEPLDKPLTL